MARDEALNVIRRGETSLLIVLGTWMNWSCNHPPKSPTHNTRHVEKSILIFRVMRVVLRVDLLFSWKSCCPKQYFTSAFVGLTGFEPATP